MQWCPLVSTRARSAWLEIDLEAQGEEVRVGARGSRGERPRTRDLAQEHGAAALRAFSAAVARAARAGRPLDPAGLAAARALHEALFQGELRDVLARMVELAGPAPVLVRLFAHAKSLSAVPFEALCRPGTDEGFLGADPRLVVARGVSSPDPWTPREVRGPVRVLAVAPGSDERALAALEQALAPSIEAGEVEWLDPIAGPDVDARTLYHRLRRARPPHVLHFLGHGGVSASGQPVLRMADDEDGQAVWLGAEAFARELAADFSEDLRLVVLEACEGARDGAFGSAAEIFAQAGADAVIAHLWPVKADAARACSTEIYRSLTGADQGQGDVGASVGAARRTLLAQGAEAFSPVLFLRGSGSVLFDFTGRRVSRAKARRRSKGLAPALQSVLDRPFTLVLGELDDERGALRQELTTFMQEHEAMSEPGLSLVQLTQRCMMMFGQEILHSLFQQSLASTLSTPVPPLIHALGGVLPPGVHITLLWRPYLERAAAESQPHRNVYAVQPSIGAASARPRVVKRAAGQAAWKTEAMLPRHLDAESDIVIVRLYGGYSAEMHPILSQPVLTEDDHFLGLFGAETQPSWLDELLSRPRIQPGLYVGLSVLDWRHRMILRWLYDRSAVPQGSVAILEPKTRASEVEMLDSGGGLGGVSRIAAVIEDPAELAALLESHRRGAEP